MNDEQLKNVTMLPRANIYHEGKVISRTGYRKNASKFTLGVITAGTYTFDVNEQEIVTIISGKAEILLSGQTHWQSVAAPDAFKIPAHSQYQIRTYSILEYLCDYS